MTAADTPDNQEEFPQNPSQKEGLGFPIIRGVSLISMVTSLPVALELGPYAGKQSGETWLLWKMLDQLKPGQTQELRWLLEPTNPHELDSQFVLDSAGSFVDWNSELPRLLLQRQE